MLAVSVIGIAGTFGGSQSIGLVGLDGNSAGGGLRLLAYNIAQLPSLLTGFWTGPLGWLDTYMQPTTTMLSFAVGAGLMFSGLRRMSWTKTIAAVGIAVLLIAVPLFTLQMSSYEVGNGVQPRYLAPMILMLAGILLSYRHKDGTRPISLIQTWVVYGFLVSAQSWALHELIRRYVSGDQGPALDLNKQIEWWRAGLPSPMAVWLIGTLGFALLALLFFVVRVKKSQARVTVSAGVTDE